eukprot:8776567-Pyramimonas_sp.AAC.1
MTAQEETDGLRLMESEQPKAEHIATLIRRRHLVNGHARRVYRTATRISRNGWVRGGRHLRGRCVRQASAGHAEWNGPGHLVDPGPTGGRRQQLAGDRATVDRRGESMLVENV